MTLYGVWLEKEYDEQQISALVCRIIKGNGSVKVVSGFEDFESECDVHIELCQFPGKFRTHIEITANINYFRNHKELALKVLELEPQKILYEESSDHSPCAYHLVDENGLIKSVIVIDSEQDGIIDYSTKELA